MAANNVTSFDYTNLAHKETGDESTAAYAINKQRSS
jgi:hypothetical protein